MQQKQFESTDRMALQGKILKLSDRFRTDPSMWYVEYRTEAVTIGLQIQGSLRFSF